MANYSILDGQITSNIKTNGVQAITGALLQGVLLDMVTALGKHYQFGGVALPAGVFTAGDENVAFFAYTAGTYTNYGGFTLDGKTLHVLAYKGTWTDTDTLIPTGAAVTQAISAALANYAKKDGIEPALVAGTAASLLGAPVEKIFQAYVARQSGRALIDQLKGNAIAWIQILQNGDFSGGMTGWTAVSGTATVTDGVLTLQGGAGTNHYVRHYIPLVVSGHKYYASGKVLSSGGDANKTRLRIYVGGTVHYLPITQTGSWQTVSGIVTAGTGTTNVFDLFDDNENNTTQWKELGLIDLTLLGIDSLTTAAEVETWLQQNIGSTGPFGYNAGTVLPFCASSLQAQSGTEDLPLAPETWEDTDGNLIFPHGGMFAAGSAFDFAKVDPDGYIRKGTRVFGAVDMGTLNYAVSLNVAGGNLFRTTLPTDAADGVYAVKSGLICAKYVTTSGNARANGCIYSSNRNLDIIDGSFSDAAAFKSAMSGVMLYYELATPVEKTLAQPVNVLFVQAAGENVSLDPANGSTPYTAAARMDLREPDAVTAGTLQNLLEALKTAGVISAYTMTWDAASGTYQFTVTA